MRQERMMRGVDGVEEVELRSVPHGVTGESHLSLIPFQVIHVSFFCCFQLQSMFYLYKVTHSLLVYYIDLLIVLDYTMEKFFS